ncbi:MAG TPA: type II toxin-antitoxin system Phd/YefM family antitoxin [Gemmataceae bacterium]|jgi:prevent-host-death family protein
MKTASVAEIKSRLGAVLKASESGPVVVTRNGRPVAVIVGVRDGDEAERLVLANSPRLQAILEKSRRQIRDGEFLTHEEFWAQVAADRAAQRRGRTKASAGSRSAGPKGRRRAVGKGHAP